MPEVKQGKATTAEQRTQVAFRPAQLLLHPLEHLVYLFVTCKQHQMTVPEQAPSVTGLKMNMILNNLSVPVVTTSFARLLTYT